MANVTKVLFTIPFALILPPLFVHRMVPAEYSAWMLILQGSAYLSMLDLGLQIAIGKFVAQYDAAGDRTASSRILSSSFAILCISALIGGAVIGVLTWRVPQLFYQMPASLIPDMRRGFLTVGLSTALALPFNAFIASFTGLQKYAFPTALAITNKILVSVALILAVLRHATLVQLAFLMAAFNLITALAQYLGWKYYVRQRVDFSIRLVNRGTVLRLATYGGALSISTVAMLFVSGLDMAIVGHFDYDNTAYYGTATAVANFMLLIIGSLFNPLVPAVSSLHAASSPRQMGSMVVTATRLCALIICLVGLPIAVGAYPLLKLWVGHTYAIRSAAFLQVLVLGTAIRQLGLPYALVVVATGKQHLASIAAVAEAGVNFFVSIYLAQRMGAIGVAIGTVVGALVSVGVHLAISMKLTIPTISLSRRQFALEGIARPSICLIPTLLCWPFFANATMSSTSPFWLVPWTAATFGIAWFVGLVPGERRDLRERASRLAQWPHARS
jgi:O-antigen/teichoic acid export membrane protein